MSNTAPNSQPVSGDTTEDAGILLLAVFSDADVSDSHTFSIDTTGTLGTVTNNNDGSFSYDPNGQFEHLAAGETATDAFSYTVDDGNGGAATETVTVTITGQNDAPVALAVTAVAQEDGPFITVTADFSDLDASDSHTFSIDTTGTLGTVTNNNDGSFSYDPNGQFEHLAAGETATDAFSYTVDDGNGGTATETVTVTITGQNDAPVALAVTAVAQEDGPFITVTADFSDLDASDSHTFSIDTTGTLGTVTNNNDGSFSYDPNGQFEHLAAGETATDTFSYTVDDGNGGAATETVTVTVTITGQNDAPVALAVAASAAEDGPFITVTADFSDLDASDSHTFSIDTTGTLGTVTNNNDGTFAYDPNGQFEHLAAGETATDAFSYTVDDGNGGTATETVTVTITGQNDAPVALAVTAVAQEDGPFITVTADFSDLDASDGHTFSIDTTGTLGTVTNNNDGTFAYDPNGQFEHLAAGETATDTFSYTVDDGHGGTATETVTVTVEGQVEPTKLISSDGITNDFFGSYVAMNDLGVVVAGAWGDDDHGSSSGSVYVYVPNSAGGYTQTKLSPGELEAADWFAYNVAVSNTGIIAAAAPRDDDEAVDAGAVYVFTPDGNGGYSEAKLTITNGTLDDRSGVGVSVNDSGVVAVSRMNKGVYVFTPDGSGDYTEHLLLPSDGSGSSQFGYSVSINNAGAVYAGAYLKDGSGTAYIYTPDGTGGYTETKISPSDGLAGDNFGFSGMVNASGTLVVGAYGQDGAGAEAGAIYIYEPDGSGGYLETKIVASDAADNDFFGFRVAINDSGVVVAGARDDYNGGLKTGSAYVYVPDGSGGYTEFKLTAPDMAAGDRFGNSVDVNSDGVVTVGATYGDGNVTNTGAVYTFVPDEYGNYAGPDGTVYAPTGAAALKLTGTDTNDILNSSAGDDLLTGGAGDDTFVFAAGETGNDSITDFAAGLGSEDVVQFETTVFADFASLLAAAADDGTHTVITIDANTSIELQNVLVADLHQDDFSFV
ncbi:Ig-like domain-containing protein [Roseibium sp. AS2]|uniref:Ig-like domain-containing protein n=1 Tax=Roseibium sp. AS2 TaxID=3135781 RepID=UPI0031736A7A